MSDKELMELLRTDTKQVSNGTYDKDTLLKAMIELAKEVSKYYEGNRWDRIQLPYDRMMAIFYALRTNYNWLYSYDTALEKEATDWHGKAVIIVKRLLTDRYRPIHSSPIEF